MKEFKALQFGSIVLTLINDNNFESVQEMFKGYPDSDYFLSELEKSYKPHFNESGHRIKYGFYAHFNNELAGMSLLGISSWKNRRGYTGADTLIHMRGKGVAPDSKPLLFYLAFEILGLNRVETGCFVSNIASKMSIEKTPGFQLEGVLREYALNSKGVFEDEYRFAILKKDWLEIGRDYKVRIIY